MNRWQEILQKKYVSFGLQTILLSTLIPTVYNVIYLNRYSGLAEQLRISLSLILIMITLALIMFGLSILKKQKPYASLILMGVVISFISITSYTGYVNYRVYTTLSNLTIQETQVNYELISLSEAPFETYEELKGSKIGVITLEHEGVKQDIQEFFETHDLIDHVEFITASTTFELIEKLYEKELDAVLIGDGYEDIFESQLGFEEIATDTRVLASIETIHNEEAKEYAPLTEAPFTVLLMGADSEVDGQLENARADSLILATVNPKTLSLTMTSIPRDTYTPITCFNGQQDKINHANNGGVQCVIDSVSELFDIEIPYYAMVNFKGFVELVDAMGGILVDVPYSFSEQNSDREFGDSMIHIEEGLQILDGEEALALSRHRKTLPNGDLGRAQSQQLVINSVISTLLSKLTSINEVLDIIDILGQNVDTNFSIEQITSSFEYGLDILSKYGATNPMDYIHIKNMVLSAEFGMLYNPMYGQTLSYAFPYIGAINDAKKHMYTNLGLMDPEQSTNFVFDVTQADERVKWVQSYYDDRFIDNQATQTKLPNFVANKWSLEDVQSFGVEQGIMINVELITRYDPLYDPLYAGFVYSQSVEAETPLENVNMVTIKVMDQFVLPDFNAPLATESEIMNWATKMGVTVNFTEPSYSDLVPEGQWILDISPGTLLSADTKLIFTKSNGVEPVGCLDGNELIDGVCVPISTELSTCDKNEDSVLDACAETTLPESTTCLEGQLLIEGSCQ